MSASTEDQQTDQPPRQKAWLIVLGAAAVAVMVQCGGCLMVTVGDSGTIDFPSPRFLWLRSTDLPQYRLPGPSRDEVQTFDLSAANAVQMTGTNDADNERWADAAGNFYSADFIRGFSYEAAQVENAPTAYVRINASGTTLSGRIEVRYLKPNFAYQIKLRGVHSDKTAFERIGYAGRWRLPGRGTNYTDADYERHQDGSQVEAYLLFDYFVTDAAGNAVREFSLDSSLHVLWLERQRPSGGGNSAGVKLVLDCSDPDTYVRPKAEPVHELLWAEREMVRAHARKGAAVRLPSGTYSAEIVLTEESFHADSTGGGWWATVYRAPVTFTIEE
jgi:hypothetical protein